MAAGAAPAAEEGWTLKTSALDETNMQYINSEATVKLGGTITLRTTDNGIKLVQNGNVVNLGLRYVSISPAGWPFTGAHCTDKGSGGTAVGQNAEVFGHQGTAMGLNSRANQYSVAIGSSSEAGGLNSLAVGYGAKALGENSLVFGEQGKVASNYGLAFGTESRVGEASSGAMALGASTIINQSVRAIAIAPYAKVQSSAYGMAFGSSSQVSNAKGGMALGVGSRVSDTPYGVALGGFSVADRKALNIGYMPQNHVAPGDENVFAALIGKTNDLETFNADIQTQQTAVDTAQAIYDKDKSPANDDALKAAKNALAATQKEKRLMLGAWQGQMGALSVGDIANGYTRQITGVAAGNVDTDAVNVAQLKALASSPITFYSGGKNVSNIYTAGTQIAAQSLSLLKIDFGDGLKAEEVALTPSGSTAVEKRLLVRLDKTALAGDSAFKGPEGRGIASVAIDSDDHLKITYTDQTTHDVGEIHGSGGCKVEVGDNITVTTTGKISTVALKPRVDMGADGYLKVGDVKINDQGRITGLSDGIEDNDAATVGQLKGLSGDIAALAPRLKAMDGRIDSVGAMGAAFSAMMPLDYDEAHRTQVSVGFGHYGGQNAVALGLIHYVNRDVLLNGGTALSSDEKSYRLGATFRLGSSPRYDQFRGTDREGKTIRVSTTEMMALREVGELKGTVAAQSAKMADMGRQLAEQRSQIERLTRLMENKKK